jgi:hypothetical protein
MSPNQKKRLQNTKVRNVTFSFFKGSKNDPMTSFSLDRWKTQLTGQARAHHHNQQKKKNRDAHTQDCGA